MKQHFGYCTKCGSLISAIRELQEVGPPRVAQEEGGTVNPNPRFCKTCRRAGDPETCYDPDEDGWCLNWEPEPDIVVMVNDSVCPEAGGAPDEVGVTNKPAPKSDLGSARLAAPRDTPPPAPAPEAHPDSGLDAWCETCGCEMDEEGRWVWGCPSCGTVVNLTPRLPDPAPQPPTSCPSDPSHGPCVGERCDWWEPEGCAYDEPAPALQADRNIRAIRQVGQEIGWLWAHEPAFRSLFEKHRDIAHGGDWAGAIDSACNNLLREQPAPAPEPQAAPEPDCLVNRSPVPDYPSRAAREAKQQRDRPQVAPRPSDFEVSGMPEMQYQEVLYREATNEANEKHRLEAERDGLRLKVRELEAERDEWRDRAKDMGIRWQDAQACVADFEAKLLKDNKCIDELLALLSQRVDEILVLLREQGVKL